MPAWTPVPPAKPYRRPFGRSRLIVWVCLVSGTLALAALTGCGGSQTPSGTARARLEGRAVLAADTFFGDAVVGTALDTIVNGRRLPLAQIPVQGFSSLVMLSGDEALALQDNGFGTLDNSADVPLRWYRLRLDFDGGGVEVLDRVEMIDPDHVIPFPLAAGDSTRVVGGADLDPESFVAMDDGSLWVGEEFGPSLLHVAADGRVIGKPVPVPVPPALRGFARGAPYLRSPDHPDLRFLRREATRLELANMPRSGGIEGLARDPAGGHIFAAVEKGLTDDPAATRRLILEFDPARHGFTGNAWFYRADGAGISIAALEALGGSRFLVLERDGAEGKSARVKRVYLVELGVLDGDGFLVKWPVCDLLDLDDPRGLTHATRGTRGLGRRFAFPFVTPECLVAEDDSTVIVVNDNNYPFSNGRRRGQPDDNEFIRLRLLRPLASLGPGAP